MRRALCTVAAMFLAVTLAACSGGSDSTSAPETPEASRFIGLWHMAMKGDPADPGLDWRFNADGTISLYDTGSTAAKGSGTCTIAGDVATGTWQNDSVNKGRFTATLTGDDTLDFEFIEDKYSPPKTLSYAGTRLE